MPRQKPQEPAGGDRTAKVTQGGFPGVVCHSEPLHSWFGLSYACYLVLPRALLQEMPESWQTRMVELLEDFHIEFPLYEGGPYEVRCRDDDGRFQADPFGDRHSYRHPDAEYINGLRGNSAPKG
jgi:hypothetical protein